MNNYSILKKTIFFHFVGMIAIKNSGFIYMWIFAALNKFKVSNMV